MFDVVFEGKKYGTWDDETLPKLAAKLGTTVDAIKAQTAEHDAKAKQSAMLEKMMAERIGKDSKMLAVLADASIYSLVAVAVMREQMSPEQRENVDLRMGELLGDLAGLMLGDLIGQIEGGELVTTVGLKGAERVMAEVGACSNAAASILTDAAQMAQQAAATETSEG